ncbi:MAG: S8 family peptidase [Rhodobacteraceae bacterium]|nr:S8 family peptidase [Paracoccaceae bacterium]MCY4327772.1 S8 family peptidase [Paracoccaceae bacterium]
MAQQNFLLGKGERLTSNIVVKHGGAPKEAPYTLEEARERLAPMVAEAVVKIDDLPKAACPGDEAVISLSLHPEYIAKSHFPSGLLREAGIEVVGSRPRQITPAKRSREREPEATTTTELFARGARSTIRSWGQDLPSWPTARRGAKDLLAIEEITAPEPKDKIKGLLPPSGLVVLEVVLHASEMELELRKDFKTYLDGLEIDTQFKRQFFAEGLYFQELVAPAERAIEIATFTSVRVLRSMPVLRTVQPMVRSSAIPDQSVSLPDEPPVSRDVRVAIFDGGIPVNHALNRWVKPYEFPGMRPASGDYLEHGVSVSSAALFGSIDPGKALPRPYSHIDHYRVLDDDPGQDPHELYEVLERIESVLASQVYDFISLSLGPEIPIEDDDIHGWTAVLDTRLSRNPTLALIAAGNGGESDSIAGLDRIQVPADCVNAMAIGACDSPSRTWKRAPYSSRGPGRSPGFVKPDLVDFGGVINQPFVVVTPDTRAGITGTGGTSLAAPSAMRLAVGVRAHFGKSLNHLAIRTLLVHTCEPSQEDMAEVGRGRVARTLDDVVLCDDDTVRVVYQGEITPAKYIRALIPVPANPIPGFVSITSTICFQPQTDPHHPSNYTRAGLEVVFRPHDGKYTRSDQMHPNTESFFGSKLPGATEHDLRGDAHKWENCLHGSRRKRGMSLQNPCFDVHYNARLEGRNFTPEGRLNYAMVVTVQAVGATDLYNQIVRQYASLIEPLQPISEIPVRA